MLKVRTGTRRSECIGVKSILWEGELGAAHLHQQGRMKEGSQMELGHKKAYIKRTKKWNKYVSHSKIQSAVIVSSMHNRLLLDGSRISEINQQVPPLIILYTPPFNPLGF